MTRWRIWIKVGDETDMPEVLTFTSAEGNAYWFEGGVVIQSEPSMLGDYSNERVVPWSQVVDYRKEGKP